jgi:hypothetical protein
LQLGITYGATTVADMNSKGITYISQTGGKRVLGVDTTYGATYTTNDVIGVAVDAVVGTIEFFKNNVSQGVIAESTISTQEYRAYWQNNSSSGGSAGWVNFGQRPFIYTPPAGFRALNTQNFPTTTIQNGAAAFDVALYTGNGTTRSVTGELFSPNLVWIKSRSQATDHALYDTVRGDRLQLESNTTGAQTYESTGLTSFDGNGFTVGSLAQVNTNAATYVAWQWDEAVSYGFDIVTYVGNGVAGRTVSHDLGVSPNMIIVKNLSSGTPSWIVAHSSLTAGRNLALNGTDAQFLPQNVAYGGITSFNSSTFTTIGGVTDQSAVNANGSGYIAYFWSAVSGFSRFASYTGNGSTDGPFVWCGFRPRWVMIKRSDSTGNWVILDTAMNPFNVANLELYPNLNLAENGNAANDLDFLSNGFKVRNTNADYNGSGATYVFAAFAENPFKIARAR